MVWIRCELDSCSVNACITHTYNKYVNVSYGYGIEGHSEDGSTL